MRRDVALVDHALALGALVEAADGVEEGARGGSVLVGLLGQVDVEAPARARQRERRGAAAPRPRRAEERQDGAGALEVEVRVVLPREANAAKDLDAVLGALEERVGGQRACDRRREG